MFVSVINNLNSGSIRNLSLWHSNLSVLSYSTHVPQLGFTARHFKKQTKLWHVPVFNCIGFHEVLRLKEKVRTSVANNTFLILSLIEIAQVKCDSVTSDTTKPTN